MKASESNNSDADFPDESVARYPFRNILSFPDFGKFEIQSLSDDLLEPAFFIGPAKGYTAEAYFSDNPNFKLIRINGEQYHVSLKFYPQVQKNQATDVEIPINHKEKEYKELLGKIFCGSIFGINSANYKILLEVAKKVLGFDEDLIKLYNYIDVYLSQAKKILLLSQLEEKIFSLSTDIYNQENNKLLYLNSRKEVDMNNYVARFVYFLASSRPLQISSISKYAQNLCEIEDGIQINKKQNDATSRNARCCGFLSLREEIEKYFLAVLSTKSNFYLYRHFYECGLLNKEKLLEIIDSLDNYNGLKWFMDILPQYLQVKMVDLVWDKKRPPVKREAMISFLELMKQDNFALFKHVVEIGENQDPFSQAIQRDDVDTLQALLSKISIKNENNDESNNGFKYDVMQYDIYPFSKKMSLILYAAFFGSEKCFNYLYLNKIGKIEYVFGLDSPLKYAMFSQNSKILHIFDQKKRISCDSISLSIELHLPNIYQWIIDNHPVPVCNNNPDLLPPKEPEPPRKPYEDPYTGELIESDYEIPEDRDYLEMKRVIMGMVDSSITYYNFNAFIDILYKFNYSSMFQRCANLSLSNENIEIFKFVLLLINSDEYIDQLSCSDVVLNLESYRIVCILKSYCNQQIGIFNSRYKNSFLDGDHKFDALAIKVFEHNGKTKGNGEQITKADIFLELDLSELTKPKYETELFKLSYLYKQCTSNLGGKKDLTQIIEHACRDKNYFVVKFLFSQEKNIYVDIINKYKNGFLRNVIASNNAIAILRLLLQDPKIDVNRTPDKENGTAFTLAAWEGKVALTRILYNTHKIDINKLGNIGESPLTGSIQNQQPQIANFLITSCPDLEIGKLNKNQKNAMQIVLSNKPINIDFLKILLKHPNVEYNSQTLMNLAIKINDADLIRVIVNHPQFKLESIEVNKIFDQITQNSLMLFLELIKNKDKLGINDVLIEKVVARVAEISFYDCVYREKMPNMSNSCPYHCAIDNKNIEVIKYLQKFPNIDVCKISEENKNTPLGYALFTQQHEIFSILLENISLTKDIENDKEKIISLGYLIQKCNMGNHNECIDHLLETCKNVEKNDIIGKNALDVLSNNDINFISTLLDKTNEKFMINMFLIFKKDFIDYLIKLDDKEIIQQVLQKAPSIISFTLQGLEEPIIITLVKNHKFYRSYQYINSIDVNCQDNKGNTLLMVAIRSDDLDLVMSTLVAPKIQLNLKNHIGKTASDIAKEKNYLNIVDLIKQTECYLKSQKKH